MLSLTFEFRPESINCNQLLTEISFYINKLTYSEEKCYKVAKYEQNVSSSLSTIGLHTLLSG